MRAPTCTDHGRLVLDLALGRLDDAGAVRAERTLEQCAECRSWWERTFPLEALEPVATVVATRFRAVELPPRRRSRLWIAAAAAVVLTVTSLALLPGPAPSDAPAIAVQPVAHPGDGNVLATMSFEPEAQAAAMDPQRLFDEGFESGELRDWSPGT